jgi:drug/metabolite transporter (DMT)-like permease
MSARKLAAAALQAVFGIFAFRLFLLYGLLHTSSFEAGIMTGAAPAVTAILAAVFLRERATAGKAAGIAGTVAGILLIQGLADGSGRLTLAHLGGNLLVLGAAASESVFNILSRAAAAGASRGGVEGVETIDPTAQAALVVGFALALCIVPALFESPVPRLAALGVREWAALVWYGVCATALAYICWYAGIKRSPAMTAAAFSGMMPLTSMLLAAAALGERAGWPQWAGGLLVAAGMVLLAADGRRGGARIKSAKALTQEKAAEE